VRPAYLRASEFLPQRADIYRVPGALIHAVRSLARVLSQAGAGPLATLAAIGYGFSHGSATEEPPPLIS